jgi:O-antigen ligase
VALRRGTELWPLVIAAALAALWPLTAYVANPLLMPAMLAVALAGAVVLRRPEWGIALTLALAPFTNAVIGLGGGGSLAIPAKPLHLVVPGLALGVLAYGALVLRGESERGRGRWLGVAVVVFLSSGVASSLQAISPSSSLTKIFALVTAAALLFGVLQICRSRHQLVVVVAGALGGLLLGSVQGVLEHYSGSYAAFSAGGGGIVLGRVEGSFGHPNAYGGFIAVLIPLALAVLASRAFSARMRWLAGTALAFALPALMFSFSRGAIAAVVLGLTVWLALLKPRVAIIAVAVVAVASVTLAPSALKERFAAPGTSGDVTLRSDIWRSAIDIYSEHPALGVGLNNFSNAYSNLPSTLRSGSQRRLLHQGQLLIPPHAQSLYLNILAEQGLVGIATFLLLVLVSLGVVYRGCHVRDPAGRAICVGAGAGLVTLAFHSLLDVTLFGPMALPVFALVGVAAVFVSLDRSRDPRPGLAGKPASARTQG